MPKIFVTHWVHPEVLALLREGGTVVGNPTRETWPREEVLKHAREAEAIMVFMPDRIDEEFLRQCPRLQIVAGAFKGYDNVDAAACARRGVWFSIIPDLLTAPTAELAIALLLGLTRNLLPGDRLVRSGAFSGWKPVLYGAGLSGAAIGIIGMGAVGRAVAARLAGFQAQILYADPVSLDREKEEELRAARLPLDELLKECRFVIVAAPLTPETLHLLNAERIAGMRRGACLINIGRGSVVEEGAVAAALYTGQLSGYAADVFEMEDRARSNRPLSIPHSLLGNVGKTLFTPHLGSAVEEARREIALETARNILQALQGGIPPGALKPPERG